jgi:hypothetical protein
VNKVARQLLEDERGRAKGWLRVIAKEMSEEQERHRAVVAKLEKEKVLYEELRDAMSEQLGED